MIILYFRCRRREESGFTIHKWAGLYLHGYLKDGGCNDIEAGYNNFFIDRAVEPGTYYLAVRSWQAGSYTLHIEFFGQNDLASISGLVTNMQQEGIRGADVRGYSTLQYSSYVTGRRHPTPYSVTDCGRASTRCGSMPFSIWMNGTATKRILMQRIILLSRSGQVTQNIDAQLADAGCYNRPYHRYKWHGIS